MSDIYRPEYDYREKPLRDWQEVVEEFNRRNPDKPIANAKRARVFHATAMKKLRKALAGVQA